MQKIKETKVSKGGKTLHALQGSYKFLDNLLEGIQVIDFNWRYLYVNAVAAQHGRRGREELLGHPMMEMYPGIENTAMFVHLKRCMKTRTAYYMENEFNYPDGSKGWFELSIQPVLEGLLILSWDFTTQKRTEAELKQVRERCNTILYEMSDAYFEVDRIGNFTFVSDTMCHYLRYPIEELLGTSYHAVTAKKDQEALAINFNNMYKTGVPIKRLICKVIRKDGSTGFAEISASKLLNMNGQVIGFWGLSHDITNSKQTENELKKQREEYRIIFDSMRPSIIYQNKEGKILRVNKAAADIFNLKPKELIGKTMNDLIPPDEADKVMAENIEVVDSGISKLGIVRQYSYPSGFKRWTKVDTIPYYDEHNTIVGIIKFSEDITDQKQIEEQLESSYEVLRKTLDDVIKTIAKIVETRDPYTAGHQQRVTYLSIAIAKEMGLEDVHIRHLQMAAAIHDIGKIYIPSDILSKPGKLSNIEFQLIKNHSQGGYDIVKEMDFPYAVAQSIVQHHERLDGSGYPNGLRGEEIILEAKILAVADTVEAMASHRPYRPALGIDKALEEISKNRDKLYDPAVVDACLRLFEEKRFELAIQQ